MGQRTDWTFTQWLELPDDGYRYEVIEGILVRESSPTYRHQSIVVYATALIFNHLREDQRPGWLVAPFGVRLSEDTVFQPDFLYVQPDRRGLIAARAVMGAPDLVGEVLSPSTEKRDLGIKRDLYAQHGVREYWIIDPEARTVLIHAEPTPVGFGRTTLFTIDDQLQSDLLAFRTPVRQLFPPL